MSYIHSLGHMFSYQERVIEQALVDRLQLCIDKRGESIPYFYEWVHKIPSTVLKLKTQGVKFLDINCGFLYTPPEDKDPKGLLLEYLTAVALDTLEFHIKALLTEPNRLSIDMVEAGRAVTSLRTISESIRNYETSIEELEGYFIKWWGKAYLNDTYFRYRFLPETGSFNSVIQRSMPCDEIPIANPLT